jgi:hypothetical protein
LQTLTGVEMKKMLSIPKIEDIQLPESKKFIEGGWHRRFYRFSPGNYKEVSAIWNGQHFDGFGPLDLADGPPQGGNMNDYEGIAEAFVPEYAPEEIFEIAHKLYQKATGETTSAISSDPDCGRARPPCVGGPRPSHRQRVGGEAAPDAASALRWTASAARRERP